MRKLLGVVVPMFLATLVYADEIYLKNESIIKGKIIEFAPG